MSARAVTPRTGRQAAGRPASRRTLAAPGGLRTEFLVEPIAIDTASPRFSWSIEQPGRGVVDTHGQVVVAALDPASGDPGRVLWDSGRHPSDGLPRAAYGGPPLAAGRTYTWRVRWWDARGRVSPWSGWARFGTGLRPEDWAARWITKRRFATIRVPGTFLLGEYLGDYVHRHAAYLRTEFALHGPVRRAVLHHCGLGFAEVRLNGARVGDSVLDPGQTDYGRGALYVAHDVTALLRAENALGVLLGNGRHEACYGFGPPRLILQLEIEYTDGSRDRVTSDPARWRAAHGALAENGIYLGERYDARLERPGWDRPGFDDRGWERAVAVDGPPLRVQALEPIRVTRSIRPRAITRPKPGTFVFDFGENVAGWARLAVRGRRGREVRLRFAETLLPDGTINTAPNENARAMDVYVLRGGGPETWEPRFTYHGFRYVELTGFPGVPTKRALLARVVHSAVDSTGSFSCSHPLINQIHENVRRSQLSNLHSVPTDCCQRDERLGWLGDVQLAAEQSVFNFGMAPFYEKLLADIRDAQRADGALPDAVPAFVKRLYPADPAWGTAYVTIAWLLYLYYGDARVLHEHYDGMRRWVDFLDRHARGGIQSTLGKYGDWCPPGSIPPRKTPLALTATVYALHDTRRLAEIAALLGRRGDARVLAARARRIERAFNHTFMDRGRYTSLSQRPQDRDPSQTSQALPLALGLVPGRFRRRAIEELVFSVERRCDAHLDTGILGTRYVPEVLSDTGHHELAFRLATQTSYPGWGYMIAEGATTLWERWELLAGPSMNSHNHVMLGSIDAWFYRYLAGVRCRAPGWRALEIKPHLARGLDHAAAEVRTVRGTVRAAWERRERVVALAAEIPIGARAEIFLPAPGSPATVRESGRVVVRRDRPGARAAGLTFAGREDAWLRFAAGSGQYDFQVRW